MAVISGPVEFYWAELTGVPNILSPPFIWIKGDTNFTH